MRAGIRDFSQVRSHDLKNHFSNEYKRDNIALNKISQEGRNEKKEEVNVHLKFTPYPTF